MAGLILLAAFGGIAWLAVVILKQFDKIAGRGPKQVADGIEMARKAEGRRD